MGIIRKLNEILFMNFINNKKFPSNSHKKVNNKFLIRIECFFNKSGFNDPYILPFKVFNVRTGQKIEEVIYIF